MAVRSKTTLFNAALTRTGNNSTSEGDGSFVWQALEANYEEIVRAAFEEGKYPFGKVRETLTSRSAGKFGYDDSYQLPTEAIHVDEVYFNECSASDLQERWDVNGETNELLVDANSRTIEVEYRRVGLEHTWSASFAKGIQLRLEAVIKDVLEEFEEASAKDAQADYQILIGGVKGAKNRSQRKVWKKGASRLVRRRRGG